MNYLRMLKLILAINKIPLLNRILNVSQIKNSGNKDKTNLGYWKNVKYAEATNYLKINLMD